MSKKRVSETNFCGRHCLPLGVWRACHQQAKKGQSPQAPQELFWDTDGSVHTCMNETTPNDPKIQQTKTKKKSVTNKENKNDKTLLKKSKKTISKRTNKGDQMNKNNIIKLSTRNRCCVRMTTFEYKQIQKDSKTFGKSVPQLLRESYFSQPPRKVLMNKNDLDVLRKDLNRIGNNLNQIARKLNSGLMEGWSNSLESVSNQLKILTDQIYYGYGVCKS